MIVRVVDMIYSFPKLKLYVLFRHAVVRERSSLRISKDDSFTVRELEYRASSIYSSISEGVFFSYDMMLV